MALVLYACKKATSLPFLAAEELGKDSQNGRRLKKGRDVPCGSCKNMTLNRHIFIVGCMQFVYSQNLHVTLCVQDFNVDKEAAQPDAHMTMQYS
jgi:hypothetical protein